MKITKRQLKRIIKEEKDKLVSMAGANESHQLGAAIEAAIALAQQSQNTDVLALLEEAHEALMGY
jgi:3-deoxy-D-arabino-heptulosonate 7-phosphate (DAHP) synthase